MGNPRGFLDFKRENLAKRAHKGLQGVCELAK